jgi:hypothetical protein
VAKRTRVKGTKELSRKLKALGVDVERKTEQAAVAGGLILQNGMKLRAPRLTRNLARSIHIGGHEDKAPDFSTSAAGQGRGEVPPPERAKGRVKIYIGTNLIYAAIQEYGGEIRPRRAPFLRFRVDGEWVIARRVRLRAQPYVRPTFEADGPEAQREVGEALRQIIRSAVKR